MLIESDSYQVSEDGGPVSVCVLKDQNVAESFAVQVATTNLIPVQAEGGHSTFYTVVLVVIVYFFPL